MRVAAAQFVPAWMDRSATLAQVAAWVRRAADERCDLVAFPEALVPGYPHWLSSTGGARFNDPAQKRWFAHYSDQAVIIERGDLACIQEACRSTGVAAILGIIERPPDRGGHSLFCSRVVIAGRHSTGSEPGTIQSVHRKLMPTYEERLVWGTGDGHALVAHPLGPFTLGSLNCWENWMPLARAAIYAQGVDLHVMLWPGSIRNTHDITPFVAKEMRGYVISASTLLREQDLPANIPDRALLAQPSETLCDGGSCIAAPDGSWAAEPVVGREALVVAEIDPARVREERQNFDPVGHYARPDVLRLTVNRERLRGAW